MAHFARLDENNIVQEVIVVSNRVILDTNGNESEAIGIDFCNTLKTGIWIQTSYNSTFRGTFAQPGYLYRSDLDVFVPPSPYPSWIFNSSTCSWDAPIPKPTDKICYWDEETQNWLPGIKPYPKPFPNWILDENNRWIPPIPYPSDEKFYHWDQLNQIWQPGNTEKPYDSWILNENYEWIAPINKPIDDTKPYYWDENSQNWEVGYTPKPYPSWVLDYNFNWISPVPIPNFNGQFIWDEVEQNWKNL